MLKKVKKVIVQYVEKSQKNVIVNIQKKGIVLYVVKKSSYSMWGKAEKRQYSMSKKVKTKKVIVQYV